MDGLRCSWITQWKKDKQWWGKLCGKPAEFLRGGSSRCLDHVVDKHGDWSDYKWETSDVPY